MLSRSKPVRPTALVCPWTFQWAVDSLRQGNDSLGDFSLAPANFQGDIHSMTSCPFWVTVVAF
jgi:hypothetical protein